MDVGVLSCCRELVSIRKFEFSDVNEPDFLLKPIDFIVQFQYQ
jgi:hypothetical protein